MEGIKPVVRLVIRDVEVVARVEHILEHESSSKDQNTDDIQWMPLLDPIHRME